MQAPLTQTLSASGSTGWFRVQGTLANVMLSGSFGGGAVAVECKSSDGTAIPMCNPANTPVSLTVAQSINLEVRAETEIRLTLSGATAPTLLCSIGDILDGRD